MFRFSDAPLKKAGSALLFVAPAAAALAFLELSTGPSALLRQSLSVGGSSVALVNLSKLVLAPYVAVSMVYLGRLVSGTLGRCAQNRSLEAILFDFFAGAGVAAIIGFAAGLSQALYPRPWQAVFAVLLLVGAYFSPPTEWKLVLRQSMPLLNMPHALIARAFRIASIISVIVIVAVKGVMIDVVSPDVMQLYYSYLAEVRRNYGTLLQLDNPVVFDFLVGRGAGLYLIVATMMDQFSGKLVSVIFYIAMALVVTAISSDLFSWLKKDELFGAVLNDLIFLIALWSQTLTAEFGKYHLATGAFLVFYVWAGSLKIGSRSPETKELNAAFYLVSFAIPLLLPQYLLLLVVCAVLIMATGWMVCRRVEPFVLKSCVIGFSGAIVSAGVNYLYVGVIDLNHYSVFLPSADLGRLQAWTSPAMVKYINYTQEYSSYGTSVLQSIASSISTFFLSRSPAAWIVRLGLLGIAIFLSPGFARRFLAWLAGLALLLAAIDTVSHHSFGDGTPWGLLATMGLVLDDFVPIFILVACCYFLTVGATALVGLAWANWSLIGWKRSHVLRLSRSTAVAVPSLCAWAALTAASFLTGNNPSVPRLLLFLNVYLALIFAAVSAGLLYWLKSGDEPYRNLSAAQARTLNRIAPIFVVVPSLVIIAARVNTAYFGGNLNPIVKAVLLSSVPALIATRGRIGEVASAWISQANLVRTQARPPGKQSTVHLVLLAFAVMLLVANQSAVSAGYMTSLGTFLGASSLKSPRDFQICDAVSSIVPASHRVLPVNGTSAVVPCQFSPLLPRLQFVHHYESNLAPAFADAAFGKVSDVRAIMREKMIDYFYIAKDDRQFFGIGYSDMFDEHKLRENFDVVADTEKFVILTWSGQGNEPLRARLATEISQLRGQSKEDISGRQNWIAFEKLQKEYYRP
jgi:hypothetical protein